MSAPTIDFEGIYNALRAMDIMLDSDPLQYGPKRLNGKVAESRAILSKCEQIFLDLSQELARIKRQHRLLEAEFALSMKDLLANDPTVRAGRNLKDREATATMMLRDLHNQVGDCALSIDEIEACLIVVKAKRSDLKDIQGRLRDQIKLCQEEISLGARWGNIEVQGIELIPGKHQSLVSGFVKKSSTYGERKEVELPILEETLEDNVEPSNQTLPNSNGYTMSTIDDILEDFDLD
jgi:hypothetical protein